MLGSLPFECRQEERRQQGADLGRIGLAVRRGPELGRGRQALGIPAQMLAAHAHARLLAVMRQHRVEVPAHRSVLFGQRRIGQPLAGPQIVDRLVQEPRPAVGAAPDHHAVGARLLEGRVDVVERIDVAVDDDRQPGSRAATSPWRSARPPRRSSPCSKPPAPRASASCNWWRRRTGWARRRATLRRESYSHAMNVPGFVFNPIALAIEGAAIGFVIAVPVGPAAALCIRRSITVGAMAGYMTGIGAALGDAVFGAVAAFGLSFVEQFVFEREAWLLGI